MISISINKIEGFALKDTRMLQKLTGRILEVIKQNELKF